MAGRLIIFMDPVQSIFYIFIFYIFLLVTFKIVYLLYFTVLAYEIFLKRYELAMIELRNCSMALSYNHSKGSTRHDRAKKKNSMALNNNHAKGSMF